MSYGSYGAKAELLKTLGAETVRLNHLMNEAYDAGDTKEAEKLQMNLHSVEGRIIEIAYSD